MTLSPIDLVLVGTLFLGCLLIAAVAAVFLLKRYIGTVLSRPMWHTLAELYISFYATPIPTVLDLSFRAQTGKAISRSIPSPWRSSGLRNLSLIPAQAARRPLAEGVVVDTGTVIGPAAAKPLNLAIPILISAMSYDVGITKEAKLALALGATMADTATNSGESGFFQPERDAAKHYIIQVKHEATTCDPVALALADAVEIHLGQGAQGSIAFPGPQTANHQRKLIEGKLPGLLSGTGAGDGADRLLPLPGPDQLSAMVDLLRKLSGGAPVGVKLLPSGALEADLQAVAAAGVDFVALDGAGAGTAHAPPTLADAFGLPIATAIPRAVRCLQSLGLREKITLIAAGGLRDPGDFLKIMALGAEAVYIGTAALYAAAHPFITSMPLLTPPTSLFWSDSPANRRVKVDVAATAVANYLESCRQELVLGVRTMGLSNLHQLTPAHLVALDGATAQATGVTFAGTPE